MKKTLIFLLILFNISICYAECLEDQIDINTASLSDLDKIIWVGPATAEKIINIRPFESVDDLIRVYGIGEKRLADIKEQDLACVEDEENEEKSEIDEEIIKEKEVEETPILTDPPLGWVGGEKINKTQAINPQPITLSPQIIKTPEESNEKNLDEKQDNYAIYGLIAFCILLVILFIIRQRRYNKSEFR